MGIALFGVALLLQQFPQAMRAIELLGGGYLLWLGIQALRHAGQGSMKTNQEQYRGFIDGLAISGLNPKIAVFFLALLGPFVPADASTLERFGVSGLALVIDGSWYVLVAVALAGTGAADWLAQRAKWVDRLLGLLLVSVGLWLLVAGI